MYFLSVILVLLAIPGDLQAPRTVTGTGLDVDLYGNRYVVDRTQNTLRKFSATDTLVNEIGGPGWENDQFDSPTAVWARNGIDVFVADYGNHRIQRFDRNLNYVSTFTTREFIDTDLRFGYPVDVAVSRLGDLFICDTENTRIMKINSQSREALVFGGFDAGKGRLLAPRQLEIGPHDRIYVLDGVRVLVFDTFGNFIQAIGREFPGNAVIFADEMGLVVVSDNNIYLFDDNDRLVTTAGVPHEEGTAAWMVHAVSLSQSHMYFLTDTGLEISANPRIELDKRLTK
ncbi:MAG: NHL repeat-containing protein [Bacteroidota bacterium]